MSTVFGVQATNLLGDSTELIPSGSNVLKKIEWYGSMTARGTDTGGTWTVHKGTVVPEPGYGIVLTATEDDINFQCENNEVDYDAGSHPYIRIRLVKLAESALPWDGTFYYIRTGESFDWLRRIQVPEPANWEVGTARTLVFDGNNAVGTYLSGGNIRRIRFDPTGTGGAPGESYRIDFIQIDNGVLEYTDILKAKRGNVNINSHSQLRAVWDYQEIATGAGDIPAGYKIDSGEYMMIGSAPIPKNSRIVEASLMTNGAGGDTGGEMYLGVIQGGKPPFRDGPGRGTFDSLTNVLDSVGGVDQESAYSARRHAGGFVVTQDAWVVIKILTADFWVAKGSKVFCSVTYMSI